MKESNGRVMKLYNPYATTDTDTLGLSTNDVALFTDMEVNVVVVSDHNFIEVTYYLEMDDNE